MRTTIGRVYIQFATPIHQEVVFLGEVTIPVDHLFLEGSVLLKDAMVNQLCVKCTLTIHWQAILKGTANRPGMHPVTIPLPTTLEVSRRLAGQMLGVGKYSTMVRLLKDTSGLATPIPANMPCLVDSGWSTLGEESPAVRSVIRMAQKRSGGPAVNRPRPSSMENVTMDRRSMSRCAEKL